MKVLIFPFDKKRHAKFYLVRDRKENSHYAQMRVPCFMCQKLLVSTHGLREFLRLRPTNLMYTESVHKSWLNTKRPQSNASTLQACITIG